MTIRSLIFVALSACALAATQGCGSSNAAPAPVVQITDTLPLDRHDGVSTDSKVAVTFNEDMVPASVNKRTFVVLESGTIPIAGTVAYQDKRASFAPSAPFKPFTVYTATVTTGVKCLDDDAALENEFDWTFVTGASKDATLPQVANTAFGVQVLENGVHQPVIVAFFSEPMDPSSVDAGTFLLTDPSGSPVPLQVQYIGLSALAYPSVPLVAETTYTATVTTGVTDLAGNHMRKPRVWTVTTPNLATLTGEPAPVVVTTNPVHGAADVLLGSEITATFGEPIDPTTLTNASFLVYAPGHVPVPGSVTVTGVNATFIPAYPLAPNTTYVVDIEPAAKDLEGVPLAAEYEWTFTTGEDVAGTPPVVQYTSPTPGELGVTLNKSILAAFTEPVDPASISTVTFTVMAEDGTPVDGMVSYTGLAAVFTPDAALLPNITYTARISTGVTDAGGEAMAADYVWQFSTGDQIADSVPQVLFTNPGFEQTQVGYTYPEVQIAFSEVMDPRTITADNIFMTDQNGTVIPGTFGYLAYVVIFTPSQPLDQFSLYTVTVKTGVKDMEGVPLAQDYSWWFTTTGAM